MDQICPKKGSSPSVENRKCEDWILHIRISLSTKFQLNLIIFIFLICPKRLFPIKHGKGEHLHRILHIQISLSTKFKFKLTILIFWTKFAKKGYFQSKMEKVNIAIESCMFKLVLGNKFYLKLTILIFSTKFTQKEYFWSKTEKVSITIEFYIFELD